MLHVQRDSSCHAAACFSGLVQCTHLQDPWLYSMYLQTVLYVLFESPLQAAKFVCSRLVYQSLVMVASIDCVNNLLEGLVHL